MICDYRHALARRHEVAVALLMCTLLAKCTSAPPALNSERIESRYGSYAVRVLKQNEHLRISSLESRDDRRAITRTLAFTVFAEPVPAIAAIGARIRGGGSIGSTFRNAGFAIDKPPIEIGSLAVEADMNIVAQLMAIELPATLALHAYRFDVSRHGKRYRYATILELHHPDYLSEAELQRIYSPSLPPAAGDAAGLRSEVRRLLLGLSASMAP